MEGEIPDAESKSNSEISQERKLALFLGLDLTTSTVVFGAERRSENNSIHIFDAFVEDSQKGVRIAILMLSCSDSDIVKTLTRFGKNAKDVRATDMITLSDFVLDPPDRDAIDRLGIKMLEVSPTDMRDFVRAKVSSMKLLVGIDDDLSPLCLKTQVDIRIRHTDRRRKTSVEREILDYVSSNPQANATRVAGNCNLNHERTMETIGTIGPLGISTAIGAVIGAAIGGAAGAVIGGVIGVIIGAILVYGQDVTFVDGAGAIWWWANLGFWNALYNIPW